MGEKNLFNAKVLNIKNISVLLCLHSGGKISVLSVEKVGLNQQQTFEEGLTSEICS